jgi:hypothetical protein
VSSFAYGPEGTAIISETDEKRGKHYVFIIQETSEQSSRLTIEPHFISNQMNEIFFTFFESKNQSRNTCNYWNN